MAEAYKRNNNGNRFGGNRFPQKPRGVVSKEHELNMLAETVIENKVFRQDFKYHGREIPDVKVPIAGVNIPVPIACMMVSHQFGFQYDSPYLPACRKLDTGKPDFNYVPVYTTRNAWPTDESFYHIPGFTRYVCNDEGTIKNAANGMVVYERLFVEPTAPRSVELVQDGTKNELRFVQTQLLQMLTLKNMPRGFIDYGFGIYSHQLKFNPEVNAITWVELPRLITRSMTDNKERPFLNMEELIALAVEFDLRNEVRRDLSRLKEGEVVAVGEFLVAIGETMPAVPVPQPTYVEIEWPSYGLKDKFNKPQAGASYGVAPQAQKQAVQAPTNYDDDLGF